MHDLVIRGGNVVDGSGAPRFRADVAVDGGRITEIGRVSEPGVREVDADGLVVSPGFIDGHTHMDAQLFWDPLGSSSCWHGVTSVVMGNCGFTVAPVRPEGRGLVVETLEVAEDISAAAIAAGIDFAWETFPEFLDVVQRLPKAINYAANIGHSALRIWAMGERALAETATEDDLGTMERQLEEALRAGAVGFTTSRGPAHTTKDGRPVASRVASWGDEVCRLVSVLGRVGTGIFELANDAAANSPDAEERARYFRQLHALALGSGVPMTFGVVPMGPSDAELFDLIEATIAAGGRMFGQTTSRGVKVVYSFRSRLPFGRIPEWQRFGALSHEAQLHALRDTRTRARLVDAVRSGEYDWGRGPGARAELFDRLWLFDDPVAPTERVSEVARRKNVDPVELMIDLALETDLEQLFLHDFPTARNDDDELLRFMTHPNSVMTFSDSGAHVTAIADSSIQTHLLSYWVRLRGALTLEHAVSMMTSRPAAAWGFPDRGLVREGMVADVNVFDPDQVAPALPVVAHDLPAGAFRLKQRSTGIAATIVGGEITLHDGEPTGATPGTLLRAQVA